MYNTFCGIVEFNLVNGTIVKCHMTYAAISFCTFLPAFYLEKVGYCNRSSAASSLTFTCGRDNVKSVSCILPKFVMQVTYDQFSDKFNNG